MSRVPDPPDDPRIVDLEATVIWASARLAEVIRTVDDPDVREALRSIRAELTLPELPHSQEGEQDAPVMEVNHHDYRRRGFAKLELAFEVRVNPLVPEGKAFVVTEGKREVLDLESMP